MKYLVTLIVAALFATTAAAQTKEENIALARERISDIMIAENIPGAAITIIQNGEVTWSEGFGVSDRQSRTAVTADTPFSLASITKSYTTMAIMMLADQGLLDLDGSANSYLGEHKLRSPMGNADAVTIRQLLTHTSGLPYHHHFFYEGDEMQRLGHEEAIRRFGVVVAPPGESFIYTNFSYGVLEYIIERISGQSFRDFLHNEIFEPASMDATFLPPVDEMPAGTALKHTKYGLEVPFYDFDHRGGAALYSSVSDLARFGMLINDELNGERRLLASIDPAEMLKFGPEGKMGVYGYAMSWHVRTLNEHTILMNNGEMPGVGAAIYLAPEQGTVIAVVANATGSGHQRISDAIMQLFTPELRSNSRELALAKVAQGDWSGEVDLGDSGKVSLAMSISEHGEIKATLDGKPIRIYRIMTGHGGEFNLSFHNGTLPTPEAERYAHRVELNLRPHEGALVGYAYTKGRAIADRMANGGMSYWAILEKTPAIAGE